MRHGKKINHLSRTSSHRKAMLSNMATSLIRHKRIKTTLAKAKALKLYVEPLLTKAKKDTVHSRRIVFSYLQDKAIINEVFGEVAEKIANRPGGYTRILKTGFRPGDNAEMCMMELVDYNENLLGGTTAAKAAEGKKRTRRGKKGAEGEGTDDIKGQAKADQAGTANEPKGDKKVKKQSLDTKNENAQHDINESMKAEQERIASQEEHLPKQVDSREHKSTTERKQSNDNN